MVFLYLLFLSLIVCVFGEVIDFKFEEVVVLYDKVL